MACLFAFLLTLLAAQWSPALSASTAAHRVLNVTALPYDPRPAPSYMVDNQHNYYHTAPDKGKQNGAVWRYSGSLDKYMANLRNGTVVRGGYVNFNGTKQTTFSAAKVRRQSSSDDYWLANLAPSGAQPFAGGDDYQFFRNVKDFGADDTGETDTTEALNAAVASWNVDSVGDAKTRCGEECGNTFSQGAIVYFPKGTYKICSPVIQYYYTQFIGDPNSMPTIKGCDTFQGIALIDTDPYIPHESGAQWYVNQNQFFRQIRNFVFDLYDMPESTAENDQDLVPTGIHWQVAQATSLQNLIFSMPATSTTTAVGIFSENGSGGFVSNIIFDGGNIGWRAGSQQYTARNLQFNFCNTAVQMVWDWGWNWQQINVNGGSIAFNISGVGGDTGQGTGSVSIIDTIISGTTVGILTNGLGNSPNIVLDNTVFEGVTSPVLVNGGSKLLSGNSDLWATGKRYNGSTGSTQTGDVTAPARAKELVDPNTGFLFVRERPQYEDLSSDSFLSATKDGGCKNDGTGDQASCINSFLEKALGQVAYFPAGIYTVGSTVFIPTGSRVQGSSWSQIQGSGFYFSDMHDPQVMVRVGNKGDVGTMEIVEILFSVRGGTAGAILMEWNTAASEQGAAAMWDSHFRVGGALGSDLDLATCPKFSSNDECIAASLMLHITSQANGYFENVWAWVADHDNDQSIYNQPDSTITQISIFGARGMLVESQGPTWFYGSGSEHSVLYNYLLSGAKSVYMGHIQTESPYFQPVPGAPAPFGAASSFPNDPDFSQCNVTANSDNEQCRYSWGLQIIDSTDVIIHGAGLYSFFNAFYKDCEDTNSCQQRILEVKGSTGVVIYNLFTVATVEIASGIDSSKVLQKDGNQRGFTTEISVWLPLPGQDNVNLVWVGTDIWTAPTVTCSSAPCLLILPTSSLSSDTTISPSEYTTSFEYGGFGTTTVGGTTVFVTSTTTVTIAIPDIVTDGIPYSNVNVSSTGPTTITIYPSVNIPPIGIPLPDGSGSTTIRTVTLPPWPKVNNGPSMGFTDPGSEPDNSDSGSPGRSTTYYTPIGVPVTAPRATVTTLTFPATTGAITISCPARTSMVFATPPIAVSTTCTDSVSITFNFVCPTTKVVTFLASTTAIVSVDCSLVTSWSTGRADSSSTTTPLAVWGTTWPPYGQIIPVTTTVDEPKPTDDGVIVPCRAWFFFICISWGEVHIGGWHWILPPGIYGPGPPPVGLIRWPPGISIQGNLPNWPKITIGKDNQITTEEKSECETQTASACTTTTYVSAGTTLSSASMCETISGCSISVSDSFTEVIGTQTPAPIGTWYAEAWPTMSLGDAYTNSVLDELSSRLAQEDMSADGTTLSFTGGATAGPRCAGASTACGGTLCVGYWCTPSPTGYPPDYQDPKDPNSGGYSAPTTTIGGSTTTSSSSSSTTRVCTVTDVCNCDERECDECSPPCCLNGTCGTTTTSTTTTGPPTPPPDPCDGFDCRACGTPFDDPCCQSYCQ
ncbi:pectin lyase fold/virulence factor [Hypoxylon fragiforme]|uniref:pectin lyase fold/virulence factor n=1 Tax=Hypoxylon fragiforme TaxID=63214 RepID=UPI0020C650D4|nr:pectin lyase fold/virulence factor [Hypoxylon fragiforme]KAI2606280.1 pectin lyase fold/virulence factor [Hypoxylon fragiforme]